jgi:molybdenum cofactor biosynthesis protein B
MSVSNHKTTAPTHVGVFVLTVSDTRTETTDTSGQAIRDLLTASGHDVAEPCIVRDEPAEVQALVEGALVSPSVQVVITTGGTGITSRDGTFEAVASLLEKRLDGFGEIFRALSYQEIGAAAMLSRAVAGTVGPKAVFVLPGSEHAVRLAMTKLILPELGHIAQQLAK